MGQRMQHCRARLLHSRKICMHHDSAEAHHHKNLLNHSCRKMMPYDVRLIQSVLPADERAHPPHKCAIIIQTLHTWINFANLFSQERKACERSLHLPQPCLTAFDHGVHKRQWSCLTLDCAIPQQIQFYLMSSSIKITNHILNQ